MQITMSSPHNVVVADGKIGAKLRSLRLLNSISEGEVAAAADLTIQEYQECEVGTRRATSLELYKIARLLRVSLPEIFEALD